MKRLISATVAVATAFILGCGDGSSITDIEVDYDQQDIFSAIPVDVEYNDYKVKVVDDNIINAKVRASECKSYQEIEGEEGWYYLKDCIAKPTYITVENGEIGESGVKQTFPLVLNVGLTDKEDNFVVTPLTTLVADANETEARNIAKHLGLELNDIFDDPDDVKERVDVNLTNTLQKVNAIYLKAESDGAIADRLKFIKIVREKIEKTEVEEGDFNVTEVAQKVEDESQKDPSLFGLIFIGDLKNKSDILSEIHKAQNPNKVTFLGLVFDKILGDANISVYRVDNNMSLLEKETKTDENGKWEIEINQTVADMIMDEDFIIMFEAKKDKILLKSSMSSSKLREIIKKHKKVTPTRTPDLIISNITTAENAVLKKRGALERVDSFENNKTELKTYYTDKVLTIATAIKNVVDKMIDDEDNSGDELGDEYDDVYEFAYNNIEDAEELNVTEHIENNATDEKREEIEENPLLSQQLTFTQNENEDVNDTNEFEETAKNKGYTFYRLLAYYKEGDDGKMGTDDDIFVREYTKIVTLPGKYETKTCYLYGNDSHSWKDCKVSKIETANFSNGYYNFRDGDNTFSYGYESSDDIYVKKLEKTYTLYTITLQKLKANEILDTTPEVLVDDFDVVDIFRRVSDEDKDSFEELKTRLKGKTRDEVNIELNRYIKERMDDIQDYFAEKE